MYIRPIARCAIALLSTYFFYQSLSAQDLWLPVYFQSYTHLPNNYTASGTVGPYDMNMKVGQIDWTALTHLIYSAVESDSLGNIVYPDTFISSARIKEVVRAAHQRGKPILLSIGGIGNWAFPIAIALGRGHDNSRGTLIRALLDSLSADSLDGIDIDMERSATWDTAGKPNTARLGIASSNDSTYLDQFVRILYDSLQNRKAFYDSTKKPLLTAAIKRFWHGGTSGVDPNPERDVNTFYAIRSKLDRIFIMTYDHATGLGDTTWHNSNFDNLYSGSQLASAKDELVDHWFVKFSAAVDKKKLCIGVDFNGYDWHAAGMPTTPRTFVPLAVRTDVSQNPAVDHHRYYWVKKHFKEAAGATDNWDANAISPYVSIDSTNDPDASLRGAGKKKHHHFIPYENHTAIQNKVDFANGPTDSLGGVFVWEAGAGFRREMDCPNLGDSLLQEVKKSVFGTTSINDSLWRGWNMRSIAVGVNNSCKTVLWPSAQGSMYTYDGGYVTRSGRLTNYEGYWVKDTTTQVRQFQGTPMTSLRFPIKSGWNMIPSLSVPLDTGKIRTVPSGLLQKKILTWVGGRYDSVASLTPGRSYWLKASANGTLILDTASSGGTSAFNSTTISVAPTPPGAPVAPLLSGSTYISDDDDLHPRLSWTNGGYGLTYKLYRYYCGGLSDCGGSGSLIYQGSNLTYDDAATEVIPKFATTSVWYYMTATDSYDQTSANSNKKSYGTNVVWKTARREGEADETAPEVPTDYFLFQNSPNPFNPSTDIQYALPEESRVSLVIYDVLGREVLTLVDEMQQAGYKSVRFDAQDIPSGMYFYRLQAGPFTAVKKMLVTK